MSEPASRRPRLWAFAALVGAYTVIIPCALVVAGSQVVAAHHRAVRSAELFAYDDPDRFGTALHVGLATLGGMLFVGSLFGVPVAFLLTGVMATLERRFPIARWLTTWLAASLVAVSPLAIFTCYVFGSPLASLPFFGFALVGSSVAWAFRHRPFQRRMIAR